MIIEIFILYPLNCARPPVTILCIYKLYTLIVDPNYITIKLYICIFCRCSASCSWYVTAFISFVRISERRRRKLNTASQQVQRLLCSIILLRGNISRNIYASLLDCQQAVSWDMKPRREEKIGGIFQVQLHTCLKCNKRSCISICNECMISVPSHGTKRFAALRGVRGSTQLKQRNNKHCAMRNIMQKRLYDF